MRMLFLGFLSLALPLAQPLAGEPLRVVSVIRTSLPPYEDANRVYRLEGEGCDRLRSGEALVLRRKGEARNLGCLKVLESRGTYALARVMIPGETYPLKGDVVLREEDVNPLPSLVVSNPVSMPTALSPLATKQAAPAMPVNHLPELPVVDVVPMASHPDSPKPLPELGVIRRASGPQRQAIYFLKGDASLSPGAVAKLDKWVREWGVEGQWVLACPGVLNAALVQERLRVLKAELLKLGVGALDVRSLPNEAESRYEAVYVIRESR